MARPISGARILLMPRKIVSGERATLAVLDVAGRLTPGVTVVFSDGEKIKTDATGRVSDRTLAQTRSADAGSKFARRFAGERIPTLEEALRLARGRINLYLDCKDVDPKRLADDVLAAGMGRQVVVYAGPDVIRAVRAISGDAIGLMTKWRPAFGVAQWVDDVRVHAAGILRRLQDGTMPCDGPWPADQIAVFEHWTETGMRP